MATRRLRAAESRSARFEAVIGSVPVGGTRTGRDGVSTPSRPGCRARITRAVARADLVVVHDDAADVLAVAEILERGVDVLELVGLGDQLVQLELAAAVHVGDERDVAARRRGAVQGALQALARHREGEQVERHVALGDRRRRGEHQGAAATGHLLGGVQQVPVGDVDRDDDDVGALAVGELIDDLAALVEVLGGVGGTEDLRLVALELDRVDRDDVLGALVPGALDGVHAHTAGADDDHGVTELDVGRVDGRSPAGGHAAADERGLVERDVLADLHARVDVDHDVRREGAEVGERADALAAGVDAVRAVGCVAREHAGTHLAHVGTADGAHLAVAAGRQEGQDDVVADLETGDVRAEFLDHAGAFVATDDRRPVEGDVAGVDVVVTVADAGGGELDPHLPALGGIDLDFLDAPTGPGSRLPQQRSDGLHGFSS
ncbi:hypothetical protein RHRU231_360088 [Rhodococcus ruber]|uniref:Uncharacterized protein n=1 Tax=Rhodococcus ruber TaxID=1830 RepID=A0A098BGV3_9NOCA|nr:hypothetical protein RHRU231_360088 [Rhodococcus ruber]